MRITTEIHNYRAMLQNARTPEEGVMMEQLRAISQNVPALYGMICIAVLALGLSFRGVVPDWQSIGVPVVMIMISLFRLVRWNRIRKKTPNPNAVRRALLQQEVVMVAMYLLMGLWVWSLLPYCDREAKTSLAFFCTFTGAVATLCALSRPRVVAVSLGLTLLICVILFVGENSRNYPYIGAQVTAAYFVFILASRSYKSRLVHSVLLHNRLNAENRRSAELAEKNQSMALSDILTGLPNRRKFFQEVDSHCGACCSTSNPCAVEEMPVVGIVDLDGFKPINDVFGHAAGDAVLVETARRLNRVLGHSAVVARLGGDEFAYILPVEVSQEEAAQAARRIIDAMAEPFRLPNNETSRVSASVGYSSRAFPVNSARDLMEQADFALFRAKEHKIGHAIEFSVSHAESQVREAVVLQALKKADLEKELELVFQPIVNSTDGEIKKVEALARWTSPDLGSVAPMEFVSVAEKAGMTQKLTRVVMRKALDQLRAWPELPSMSVNLSAQDVISRETSDALVAMLLEEPESVRNRLIIEVTESSLLNDLEEARYNLLKFRFLGLKIALDDFGTGYSSLRYLQELEFDIVKIDRSFGSAITTKAHGLGLVATIQHLCRSLGIECIIEGIETREQLEVARSAGCRLVQGYLYTAPLEAGELKAYLTGEKTFAGYRELLQAPARDVA